MFIQKRIWFINIICKSKCLFIIYFDISLLKYLFFFFYKRFESIYIKRKKNYVCNLKQINYFIIAFKCYQSKSRVFYKEKKR